MYVPARKDATTIRLNTELYKYLNTPKYIYIISFTLFLMRNALVYLLMHFDNQQRES